MNVAQFPALLADYRPFIDPLPIYAYWYWMLLPLCLIFSVVYKALRVDDMKQVPRAAVSGTFWILLMMGVAAVVLAVIVKVLE